VIILNIPTPNVILLNKKNMKIGIILLVSAFLSVTAKAQSDHATQIANKIGQKMKDSLNLTGQQKNAIVNINITLSDQKKLARKQHSRPLVITYLQKIENTRDSLYKLVLPTDKYRLYKQKKNNLVNNN